MKKEKELIKHAAVKTTTGMVLLGKCHADCFWQGKNLGLKMSLSSKDQGFFTNKGRYVSREQAAKIAKKARQLKTDTLFRKNITALLSEDIWYRRDIIYCQQRGYVRIKRGEIPK